MGPGASYCLPLFLCGSRVLAAAATARDYLPATYLPSPPPAQQREHKRVLWTKENRGYLSRVLYVHKHRLYMASSLDMQLHVYDAHFELLQSVPSSQVPVSKCAHPLQGVQSCVCTCFSRDPPSPAITATRPFRHVFSSQRSVLCLRWAPDKDELVSAGIDGLKFWRFSGNNNRNKQTHQTLHELPRATAAAPLPSWRC